MPRHSMNGNGRWSVRTNATGPLNHRDGCASTQSTRTPCRQFRHAEMHPGAETCRQHRSQLLSRPYSSVAVLIESHPSVHERASAEVCAPSPVLDVLHAMAINWAHGWRMEETIEAGPRVWRSSGPL